MNKISFIGGGVMGEAMVSAILDAKVSTPRSITVSDASQQRRDVLSNTYRVKTTDDNGVAVFGADAIVLAVKPQNLKAVMAELQGKVRPAQLVVSIVAGAKIGDITEGLKHGAVVRAMPNMPAQVRRGMTVWTASPDTGDQQKTLARTILGALGKEIWVGEEKYVDMATAVSGSGPAFVFLIIEALTDAAVHIGFPRNVAEQLVLETVAGSTYAVEAMRKHPAELKNMVTSPGGTTAEALLVLEKGGLRALLTSAVISAYE
ncbi:MAG: pyrroline-5-carboxylate reductase, partial [Dehalococcoidia bacterium]|nr:pyrroline-5-carboxylate reductase [Dehalococcoidia bacterium]